MPSSRVAFTVPGTFHFQREPEVARGVRLGMGATNPGVLLSVRWGDQGLAHEFMPLTAARTFSIGTGPKCDFACGGSRSLELVDIDGQGGALWNAGEEGIALERGAPQRFEFGPLTFEAALLDAPPPAKRAGVFDFTTMNTALVIAAAFGFFAVAAANRDAEGADLDDGLNGGSTKVLKILSDVRASASASAAAPHPQKSKPTPSAPPRARQTPPARPSGKVASSQVVDVGALFKGPGALKLISGGGGPGDLLAAASGLKSAQAGDGWGGLGAGHAANGNGLGGMALEGIGRLGTHGRGGGEDPHGVGNLLGPKEKPDPKIDQTVEMTCATDGCLDKEMVRRVIHQNLAGFRYCYESLLNRYPGLEGKVAMRFSIAQSGKVPLASVAQTTANNAELESCVSDRTRLLQFPSRKWAGLVVVTYPFIFKQGGK